MFDRVQYQNADKTVIAGIRADGTMRIIEPTDPDMWKAAVAGFFGPVAAFVAPEPAPADLAQVRAKMRLTFAELLIGLVAEGWITMAEGDAWATGNGLPELVLSAVATLPEAQQFPARARLYRMSVALRTDPMVEALAVADGRTPAEVDDFFLAYAG